MKKILLSTLFLFSFQANTKSALELSNDGIEVHHFANEHSSHVWYVNLNAVPRENALGFRVHYRKDFDRAVLGLFLGPNAHTNSDSTIDKDGYIATGTYGFEILSKYVDFRVSQSTPSLRDEKIIENLDFHSVSIEKLEENLSGISSELKTYFYNSGTASVALSLENHNYQGESTSTKYIKNRVTLGVEGFVSTHSADLNLYGRVAYQDIEKEGQVSSLRDSERVTAEVGIVFYLGKKRRVNRGNQNRSSNTSSANVFKTWKGSSDYIRVFGKETNIEVLPSEPPAEEPPAEEPPAEEPPAEEPEEEEPEEEEPAEEPPAEEPPAEEPPAEEPPAEEPPAEEPPAEEPPAEEPPAEDPYNYIPSTVGDDDIGVSVTFIQIDPSALASYCPDSTLSQDNFNECLTNAIDAFDSPRLEGRSLVILLNGDFEISSPISYLGDREQTPYLALGGTVWDSTRFSSPRVLGTEGSTLTCSIENCLDTNDESRIHVIGTELVFTDN